MAGQRVTGPDTSGQGNSKFGHPPAGFESQVGITHL